MNCKAMMQIPELENVLKLKAGEKGLQRLVRWIYSGTCRVGKSSSQNLQ